MVKPGPAVDQRQKARDAAFRLLAVRARSRRELRERLKQKGFDAELIDATLDDLQEKGYQSDEDFARQYAGEKWRNAKWGPSRLRAALASKGIEWSLADRITREIVGEDDLFEMVMPLAEKRWRTSAGLPIRKRKQRLIGFLQRRGYSWDVIGPVLEKLQS
ncbi:MAG: RecX family transcriptional regulator [Candidatus Marinimicrobia bacterium]|nr:RecX family transcriptional regulator [Candidatus Neomarinimicrobiota bacterium]